MNLTFRKAIKSDIPFLIEMISNDKLGKLREDFQDPLPEKYYQAFENINSDSNQELIVVQLKGEVVGTLQLTFIQYLTYQGGIRAQVEGVRIHESKRGLGLGQKFMEWTIDRAKEKGAHLLQLTTDKKRPEAIKFYEKLGFTSSHEGMKMHF